MKPEQLTLEQAFSARDVAMQQVESNAQKLTPGFSERAEAFILDYLRTHGATPGETITIACCEAGIVPHDERAFGPVYMRLSKTKKIVKCGTCPRKRGHGTSGGNIWKLT
jgi:hypothetical protein